MTGTVPEIIQVPTSTPTAIRIRMATSIELMVAFISACRSSYRIPKQQESTHISTPSNSRMMRLLMPIFSPMKMMAMPKISISIACQGFTVFFLTCSLIEASSSFSPLAPASCRRFQFCMKQIVCQLFLFPQKSRNPLYFQGPNSITFAEIHRFRALPVCYGAICGLYRPKILLFLYH